ncbi:hypothetical protein GCM10009588_03810 [Microbacterium phyllosphaerae]
MAGSLSAGLLAGMLAAGWIVPTFAYTAALALFSVLAVAGVWFLLREDTYLDDPHGDAL